MNTDFDNVEFDTSNPEPRCPCILLLDTSGSMAGEPISELSQGLKTFKDALLTDELAMLRIELAIVTFGDSVAITQDFISADHFTPPTLQAGGLTPMGAAIELGLDMLEGRKQVYKSNGTSYYRPWIFLVTDGVPTDSWQAPAQAAQQAEAKNKLAFFTVGVEDADMAVLAQIASPNRPPLHLKGLDFREMFIWLSASLNSVSHSRPGTQVSLPSPSGWGAI